MASSMSGHCDLISSIHLRLRELSGATTVGGRWHKAPTRPHGPYTRTLGDLVLSPEPSTA